MTRARFSVLAGYRFSLTAEACREKALSMKGLEESLLGTLGSPSRTTAGLVTLPGKPRERGSNRLARSAPHGN